MARALNGTSDYLKVGTPALLNITGPITVAGWGYLTASSQTAQVCSKGYDGTNTQYQLYYDTDHVMHFGTFNGVHHKADGATTVTTNAWQHVAGTFDGSTYKVYLNGSVDGTTNDSTAPLHTAYAVEIGSVDALGSPSQFWRGQLAEVAIWNTALTTGEIASLAAGALPCHVRPGSLVGYWPLWGLSSPEPDLSGNANNATLTGTTQASHAPVAPFTRQWASAPFVSLPSGIVVPGYLIQQQAHWAEYQE